eukprot:5315766-Amphidinium_carterae.1
MGGVFHALELVLTLIRSALGWGTVGPNGCGVLSCSGFQAKVTTGSSRGFQPVLSSCWSG